MKKAKKISKKASKRVEKKKVVDSYPEAVAVREPAIDEDSPVVKLSRMIGETYSPSATEARVKSCGWVQDVNGSL